MKVLHLLHSLNTGGAERLVLNLCRKLAEHQKVTPFVCALTKGGDLAPEFSKMGIPVFSLNRHPHLDFGLALKIRELILKNSIDILHTHNVGPWIYGTLGKTGLSKKHVHTEHSNVIDNDQSYVERFLSYFTNVVICDSHAVANVMLTRQKINPGKIKVILNGVDVDAPFMSKDGALKEELGFEEKLVIGTVARLDPIKDHKGLISAFILVKEKFPDAFLLLVGDGPMRKELESLIHQKGLSESVMITGMVSDVKQYLHLMDIFVLSSFSEGLSMALLEAMAHGRPVVATHVGGNPEVVVDQETGLLTPPNDPKGLAEAMLWMLSNRERAAEMGRNGRERVVREFSIDKMVMEYEQIYSFVHRGCAVLVKT